MRNLLLLLLLANILYWMYETYVQEPDVTGVVVVRESELGPPLDISKAAVSEAATSVGAVLGSGKPTDLQALVGRTCVSIGPFKTSTEAEAAMAEYVNDGMRGSVRMTDGQVFVGHWVQIRNIPDRSTANGMLEKLQSGGLGESYIVSTEDEGLKISLGLFGNKSSAERIELQARSLDLPAEISPRMSDAKIYFVDLGLPPGRGAGAIVEKHGEENVLLRDQATCPRSE